jgi:hypothetical protein
MARSSAMALGAVKRFRHDAFARIPAVSANSASNAGSS